jgi:hypothetical protein
MVVSLTKKSGKGLSDKQVSELTTFFTIKPGHTERLRAALQRFGEATDNLDPKLRRQIGLHALLIVIFDNGRRLMFSATFETDWDPYIDDGIAFIGLPTYVDWLQHLNEFPYPDGAPITATNAEVKQLLQTYQEQATWFHDGFGSITLAQFIKGGQLAAAFEQVLNNPAAAQALQQPALKPLLELAAD